MVVIAQETPADLWQVEALYDLSFAPGREALSSYRLRDGRPPEAELCLVARDDYDVVVGAIRFWRILIGQEPESASALLLGPIAVHPIRQGEGLGALLMGESLAKAQALGWRIVVLIGDAPYYGRFGFEPAADTIGFPPPTNPKRILAKPLTPGALDGVSGQARRWSR